MLGIVNGEPAPNGLVSLRECAEALGVSHEAIRHRVKSGQLPVAGRREGPGPRGVVLVSLDAARAVYEARPARPRPAASNGRGARRNGGGEHEPAREPVHGRQPERGDPPHRDEGEALHVDGVTGACEQLAGALAVQVLQRVDALLGERVVELERQHARRREAAERAERELAAAARAREAAEEEYERLRLSRRALNARRAEMAGMLAGRE